MRPNNRIYCNDIGRSKMLFETEKKAKTFIKFNSNEILETSKKAPIRAYYCECCGGWHVTSMKYAPHKYNRIDSAIKAYKSMKKHESKE